MAFSQDIRQWHCHNEFAEHLQKHDPAVCKWVNGVVIHHTYRPTPEQWNGETTLRAIQRYYQSLGWSAGPHLFICFGSPNPKNDGIWQLTPLNMRGIHAGVCNSSTIGIEVVGNYDVTPWSDETSNQVCSSIAHFIQWRSIHYARIVGHRDCNSPKTCPGKAININTVRDLVESKRIAMYSGK